MKAILLILFAGYVSSQYVPSSKQLPREKPGTCPVSQNSACECVPEMITCKGDNECPGSQKCCSDFFCACKKLCIDLIVSTSRRKDAKKACPQQNCTYKGERYSEGSVIFDRCITCSCLSSGRLNCSKRDCNKLNCTYDGKSYLKGQSFPSVDGCNTCSCESNGRVICTKRACIKPIKDVCSQSKVVGWWCRATFRRFWYSRLTNRCERFMYRGCGGNENNFGTLQECQRRCQTQRNT